jgi:hypothetical protein
MAIPKGYRKNFDTLLRAAKNGDLALMECQDAASGTPRYVLCAVQREDDGGCRMIPFGHLADGNPYETYLPPNPGDPTGFLPANGANAGRPS